METSRSFRRCSLTGLQETDHKPGAEAPGAQEDTNMKDCVICGEGIDVQLHGWADGHNAEPVKDGRCCSSCNSTVVIPARLKQRMEDTNDGR